MKSYKISIFRPVQYQYYVHCSICLSSFQNFFQLITHLKYHNYDYIQFRRRIGGFINKYAIYEKPDISFHSSINTLFHCKYGTFNEQRFDDMIKLFSIILNEYDLYLNEKKIYVPYEK